MQGNFIINSAVYVTCTGNTHQQTPFSNPISQRLRPKSLNFRWFHDFTSSAPDGLPRVSRCHTEAPWNSDARLQHHPVVDYSTAYLPPWVQRFRWKGTCELNDTVSSTGRLETWPMFERLILLTFEPAINGIISASHRLSFCFNWMLLKWWSGHVKVLLFSSFSQIPTSWTTRTCLMSPSWWRENPFMHTRFCCLQRQPGVEPLLLNPCASLWQNFPEVIPTILCFTQVQVTATE